MVEGGRGICRCYPEESEREDFEEAVERQGEGEQEEGGAEVVVGADVERVNIFAGILGIYIFLFHSLRSRLYPCI